MSQNTQENPEVEPQEATETNENSPQEDVTPPKEPRSQDVLELDGMIDVLEEKLDKVMRSYADAENRAKRAIKDHSDALKYGGSKMARDLLEVADNLRRGLEALPESEKENLKDFISGIELTEKSLLSVFEKHDIKQITPKGEAFNPQFHEAVSKVPSPDHTSGTIIDVIRPGYIIGERLLRPAEVVVCA